jgi:hypothetical protein
MMQNPTLSPEESAKLTRLTRILAAMEVWPDVAAYWDDEAKNMLEELRDPDTNPVRTQFIRGWLSLHQGIKDFPDLVKAERESLVGQE